jgi:two-component system, response regulator
MNVSRPDRGGPQWLNAFEFLLVEDDRHDVELTLRCFGKAGLADQIKVVRDGVEALDYLLRQGLLAAREARSSIVLLDLKLPRVDGIEVIRRMKDTPCARSIPIIVLASSIEHPDVAESVRLGANGYIRKPVKLADLIGALQGCGMS